MSVASARVRVGKSETRTRTEDMAFVELGSVDSGSRGK